MQPVTDYDFNYSNLLSEILKHPKLRDYKYGKYNSKRVSIGNPVCPTFYASAYFVKSLLKEYGDMSFGEALTKWETKNLLKKDK